MNIPYVFLKLWMIKNTEGDIVFYCVLMLRLRGSFLSVKWYHMYAWQATLYRLYRYWLYLYCVPWKRYFSTFRFLCETTKVFYTQICCGIDLRAFIVILCIWSTTLCTSFIINYKSSIVYPSFILYALLFTLNSAFC